MAIEIPDTATCKHCGYSLRGLPAPVCPECGRRFWPLDPSSFNEPSHRRWWHKYRNPPRGAHLIIPVVVTVIAAYYFSSMWWASPLATFILLSCSVPLLLSTEDYLTRCGVRLLKRDAIPASPGEPAWRRRRPWLVLPVCLALIGLMPVTNWPLCVRVTASLLALEPAAQDHLGATARWTTPQPIGLFRVRGILSDSDTEVLFLIRERRGRLVQKCIGLVYYTEEHAGTRRGRHLVGNSYVREW